MAALVFPNIIYVSGFPAGTSRQRLLGIFGGHKGHIRDLQFTNTPGKPKRAFIEYTHENSIPYALEMNGERVENHTLEVRVVDEDILCHHIPGEQKAIADALENLKKVLGHVMKESRSRQFALRELEIFRLTERATAIELKRLAASYNAEREQSETLKVQIAQVRAQLEISEGALSQAQAQCDSMNNSLLETQTQLHAAQELMSTREYEAKELRRRLQGACDQKEVAMERLGERTKKVATLEEELRVLKDERFKTRSDLRRTQKDLDEADIRSRTTEAYAENAFKKRKRAEEWLKDEREAKRHNVLENQKMEDRFHKMERQIKYDYVEKLELDGRLTVAVTEKQEVEKTFFQTNSRLDETMIMDSLLAAFIKMENWAVCLLGEDQGGIVPSGQ